MMANKESGRSWLLFGILALALLLRLAFLLKGASAYYGAGNEFTNGDTFSYVRSFINLWEDGHYTLEPLIPDASFGRLPGYPFFYGLHYLVLGEEKALLGVAITQLLLDTVSVWLIYLLLKRWSGFEWAGLFGAFLYATYPFAIVWVTVTGTESLNTFFTLLWLLALTRVSGARSGWHYFLIGLLVAVTFFVREFMGLLLPVSIAYVLLTVTRGRWQAATWVAVGFLALYCWWPIRNYVNHDRIVLVKPPTAGYANQGADMRAFLRWLHSWTNDNATWVEGIAQNKNEPFPREIFGSDAEAERARQLTLLAQRCGSSFYLRKIMTHDYRVIMNRPNCNEAIAAGFDSLRQSYIQRHPVGYWTGVPVANLRKAVFKMASVRQDVPTSKKLIQTVLFAYRTLLLLIGFAGMWVFRRQRVLWPILAYTLGIYFYISFFFRSLEMRYLLQVDVMMLLPAAWVLFLLARRFNLVRTEPKPEPVAQVR